MTRWICGPVTNLAGHLDFAGFYFLNAPLIFLGTRDHYHNSLQIKSVLCMGAWHKIFNKTREDIKRGNIYQKTLTGTWGRSWSLTNRQSLSHMTESLVSCSDGEVGQLILAYPEPLSHLSPQVLQAPAEDSLAQGRAGGQSHPTDKKWTTVFRLKHRVDKVLSFISCLRISPKPLNRRRVCVPPPLPLVQEEGHTRLREKGGVPIPTRGHTLWYSMYICTLWGTTGKSLQVPAHGVMALTRHQVYFHHNRNYNFGTAVCILQYLKGLSREMDLTFSDIYG